jgi:anti-sigma regulatory factor (Ser/Thr protein kinase)
VTGSERCLITEVSQVGEARRIATARAIQLGFSESERGKVALVVTEAANNLVRHAGGGLLLLRSLRRDDVWGLEVMTLDKGPGMRNVAQCLQDGYSTAGTAGNGLGAIARLSCRFDLYSTPGSGTALLAQLWSQPVRDLRPAEVEIGAVCVPLAGEPVCGDAWAVHQRSGRTRIMLVDGLGHGLPAADAARAALQSFEKDGDRGPQTIVQQTHLALQGTRGAVVAVAEIHPERGQLRFAGVGNIAGSLITVADSHGLVSYNGTVGHQVRKIQEFEYPWSPASLLVLHSDGLETKWRLALYPGLTTRDPGLIAGILYRDFSRERDDVTVLVARQAGNKPQPP